MSSSSRSDRLAAGLAVSLASIAPVAAEPVVLTEGAYFALTAENDGSDLEVGVALPAGSLVVRPYGRIPFADADAGLVRVDGGDVVAKLGVGLDLGLEQTGETGPASFWVLGAQAEVGTDVYAFTPPGAAATEERHQSFATRVLVRHGRLAPRYQLGPQLSIAYERGHVAADPVGVVVPGTDGAPDTVQEMVMAPPTASPTLAVRAGTSLYLPAVTRRIGFGAYVVHTTTGGAGAYRPWSEASTTRGELWFYGFVERPTSTRLGLAVFAESSRAEDGADRVRDGGVLVQLKANTTLLEY